MVGSLMQRSIFSDFRPHIDQGWLPIQCAEQFLRAAIGNKVVERGLDLCAGLLLQLNFSLLSFELVNIDFLVLKEFVLLLLEFLNLEIESLLLRLFNGLSDSFVVLNETLLLSVKF